jgi:hypothetical protein
MLLPDPGVRLHAKRRARGVTDCILPRAILTLIHKKIHKPNARRNNAEIRTPLVPPRLIIFDNHDLDW